MKKISASRKRKIRVRYNLSGTSDRPRLSVFRSSQYLYGQVINDEIGKTLAYIDTKKIKGESKTDQSKLAGEELAKELIKLKISACVFDRGPYKYTGRVKSFAEGVKSGGVKI